MTWEELKEKAKELGYKPVCKIPRDKLMMVLVNEEGYGFYPDGIIEQECTDDDDCCGRPFAYDRTPDQMFAIMKALQ